jgi:VWFA-related protein
MNPIAENRALIRWIRPLEFPRTILTLVLMLAVLAPNSPLDGQQQSRISVETNMVTVFATVRDKHSKIISNLTRDDFALDEDGRPQTITYFARENDLPLTVGLLVDTSLSQKHVLDQERDASAVFVEHSLRADKKDQAFLIHFDREVELLQELTSSPKKLQSALNLLQTPEPEEVSERGGHSHGAGTVLYDAVFLASDELMKKRQGRKALIVLTDGVDRGSKETLASAIESAQRANTVVYSILFKDDQPSAPFGGLGGHGSGGGWGHGGSGHGYPQQQEDQHPDGKKTLDQISRQTGGRLFEVSKNQPIDQIYDQIEKELRSQYIMGYVPDKSTNDSGYHKIHLTTKQKDLAVQARDGYYSEAHASGVPN